MASSDCVTAKFKSPTEDSMLVIEWEKHEGHRLLHYFKHPSQTEYGYPHSKTNYGKNVSEVFPALRRRCLKNEEFFVEINAGLSSGSLMRKEGDKYIKVDGSGRCTERSVVLTKGDGVFDLSIYEHSKPNCYTAADSSKMVEGEIFQDLSKALTKMGKILKQDDEQSELEHQAFTAYLKDYMEKQPK